MICLVGDILTDVTLPTKTCEECKMRLGGIVHAARGLWAMGVEYSIAYFAPSYIDEQINMYLHEIGCTNTHKLGNVMGSPYVMLINDVKEVGNQGYESLYRDRVKIEYNIDEIKHISDYDELMFISGYYDMEKLLTYTRKGQPIHVDVANNVTSIDDLPTKIHISTLFISTSSTLFHNTFSTINDFFALFSSFADKIVLKENRGGSRAYDAASKKIYQIASQTTVVAHSVGVGDVYDVVSIVAQDPEFENRLVLASWVAMCYAMTTFPDDFSRFVGGIKKSSIDVIKNMEGCILPWESRQQCVIYIAAPDFDFIDTKPIDDLCSNLIYHHFIPRRPVKEIGQMSFNATKQDRMQIYAGDMAILNECNMLIAVLLNNDPGTFIEIGLAAQKGIPTLVYDPYGIANNCMLTELPKLVSGNMDEIIKNVFVEYSKLYKNEAL